MTTPDNCKKTLYDDLLSLLSSTCVIRVVLLVSYLLVSYFVINFLRRIFSVCHSFRSMCVSGRMKGFERCFKVEDQGTWYRQNLHAAILQPPAKRLRGLKRFKLYEPHLGKEKPVMGNIEFLLGITKPTEGLNKPCQGNLNGRKSFAAEGFNVKIPFIIRKLWQFPSDKVILELVILLNITQGSFLDGIHQIAKLTGYAAEVLRTLSSRHRIYTVYFAILL